MSKPPKALCSFGRLALYIFMVIAAVAILPASVLLAAQEASVAQVDVPATATALARLQQSIFATQTALAAPATPARPTATRVPRPTVVSLGTAADTPTARVLVNGLNIRSGPGTGYAIIGNLSQGQQVPVLGQAAGCAWLNVTLANGRQAWISGAAIYVALNTACTALPVVAAPAPAVVATPAPATPRATAGPRTPTPVPPTSAAEASQGIAAPVLVAPDDRAQHTFNRLRFYWRWQGELQPGWGFEVRGWQEGAPHNGLHDARATAGLKPDGNGVYSYELTIPSHLTYANWNWTVAVVQLEPYARIGAEAAPRRIFVDTRTPTPVLTPTNTPAAGGTSPVDPPADPPADPPTDPPPTDPPPTDPPPTDPPPTDPPPTDPPD